MDPVSRDYRPRVGPISIGDPARQLGMIAQSLEAVDMGKEWIGSVGILIFLCEECHGGAWKKETEGPESVTYGNNTICCRYDPMEKFLLGVLSPGSL